MTNNSVITIYRRELLCKLTSGAITSIPEIKRIAFGDGGTDGNGEPIPPVETATALKHELARYDIDSVTYPISTTARYSVTVPANDLAGASVSEAALVDANGKLCAIKTMYIKRKDEGVVFSFSFDDEF